MNRFFSRLKRYFCGRGVHGKNAVRYLLVLLAFLLFLFFSNDFDLINVQKTAIVMAVGIDKQEDEFSITSQIAVTTSGEQSGSQTVNVVTKGKTVAQALDKVNEKTGWYPKLVFCRLILLGEELAKENVFDALDYFLRDEYVSDDCLIAVCEGSAQQLLSTKTPIEPSSALAIEKVLSNHAQRVGTTLPNTLRLFSASYYGEEKSGYLPLLSAKPIEEGKQEEKGTKTGKSPTQGQEQAQNDEKKQEEKVFSASQTALFIEGKQIGKLDEKETFAYALVKNDLRLAAYSLPYQKEVYTLTIKRSTPSLKLKIDKDSSLQVTIKITVGLSDVSKAQTISDTADAGDFPKEILAVAAKKIEGEIAALFEKCRELNFDAFDAIDKLQKYENKHFEDKKDTLLGELRLQVKVQTSSIR